jgi:hypothetical protein
MHENSDNTCKFKADESLTHYDLPHVYETDSHLGVPRPGRVKERYPRMSHGAAKALQSKHERLHPRMTN